MQIEQNEITIVTFQQGAGGQNQDVTSANAEAGAGCGIFTFHDKVDLNPEARRDG